MTAIRIPAHAVIIMLANAKRNPAIVTELAERADFAFPEPWDVMHPAESADRIKKAVSKHDVVRVYIRHSHAKARSEVAKIARRHGAGSVCVQIQGADNVVDAKAEKIDQHFQFDDVSDVSFEVVPMPSDMRHIRLIDFIGDVHGCADELKELLTRLGHMRDGVVVAHPEGRVPLLLGDFTDRGPRNLETLRIARAVVAAGGLAIVGNHDDKLIRWLEGRNVRIAAGLQTTIDELQVLSAEERLEMAAWLSNLQSHYVLDGGAVVAAHAGLKSSLHGRHTDGARSYALYGDVTGGLDANNRPEANDWALEHDGKTVVVHGHVVHPEPRVVNGVVAIDTGCVFGGSLTAYRWPEREFVSVKAYETYCEDDARETA